MNRFTLVILCLFLAQITNAQIINFPDSNFKNALLTHSSQDIDTNNDDQIQVSEAAAATFLFLNNKNISNLTGIEFFVNIWYLEIEQNQITSLNLSTLSNLQDLHCGSNLITNIPR